uniref:EGF-like domain-containing protein n=1 Tax=Magallana gigas TaxID=29159 RepID=A0A8W8L7J5_MAGGI
MCEESVRRDGVICCFNYYHNGSACVHCLPGYYENDCTSKCEHPSYGDQCYKRCKCDLTSCHHVTGCIADYNQSSQFPTESPETFSTQHVPIFHETHSLGNVSSNTEKLQYSSYSITNTKTITILNSISTDSNIIDASMAAPKSILFEY